MEKIVTSKTRMLDPYLRNFVLEANQRQFGDVPIVREHQWAPPDWTMVYLLNGDPVSFLNVMERVGQVDGKPMKIAGINNVMTLPEHRNGGYSSKLMTDLDSVIFQKLKADIGLLLCATALMPFYERFGWKRMSCPLVFDQPQGGKVTWKAETMTLTRDHSLLSAKSSIDLCGLPW